MALTTTKLELPELLFQPHQRQLFVEKLGFFANSHHFSHDCHRLPQSLTMFYVGMVSTLFRTMVTRRQRVVRGLLTVELNSLVFTSFHTAGAKKWMQIFVFHAQQNSERDKKNFDLQLDTYDEVEKAARKWAYRYEHLREALDNVEHIFYTIEAGKLKFGAKTVQVQALDATFEASAFVIRRSKEVISSVPMG